MIDNGASSLYSCYSCINFCCENVTSLFNEQFRDMQRGWVRVYSKEFISCRMILAIILKNGLRTIQLFHVYFVCLLYRCSQPLKCCANYRKNGDKCVRK